MAEAPKIEFDENGRVIPFAPHPMPPLHDQRSIDNANCALDPINFPEGPQQKEGAGKADG